MATTAKKIVQRGKSQAAAAASKDKSSHAADIGMDLITFEVLRNAFVAFAT